MSEKKSVLKTNDTAKDKAIEQMQDDEAVTTAEQSLLGTAIAPNANEIIIAKEKESLQTADDTPTATPTSPRKRHAANVQPKAKDAAKGKHEQSPQEAYMSENLNDEMAEHYTNVNAESTNEDYWTANGQR